MKMGTFSKLLYDQAAPVWAASHRHPFLQELRQGILGQDRFAYYMKQDYVYLIDYAKVFAYGSIKAGDLETMGVFAKLLDNTLNTEMALHRQYAARFGISREELEQTEAAPTTVAYTKYLLDAASSGTLAELTAVLLPCMWSYCEIGRSMADSPAARHPFYGEWVAMYASAEFQELNDWCIVLMDRLAGGLAERDRLRLVERFVTASRLEYMFWDMAYKKEEWPV